MSIEDELQRPGGAGRAIDETWNRLRRQDPEEPAEDPEETDHAPDDLGGDERGTPLDSEVMDEPDDLGSHHRDGAIDSDNPDDPGTAAHPTARYPF
jgi:hypothetical protein